MSDDKKRVARRPYKKPQIEEEQVFERKALLACASKPGSCDPVDWSS